MKYLIDTCVLIWSLEGNEKKLDNFINIIINPKNSIFVSIASYWEIEIKRTLGRIQVPDNLSEVIEESGFIWLDIKIRHIKYLRNLPIIHNDPFDRLLIAQAKIDKLKILTTDTKILQYQI